MVIAKYKISMCVSVSVPSFMGGPKCPTANSKSKIYIYIK